MNIRQNREQNDIVDENQDVNSSYSISPPNLSFIEQNENKDVDNFIDLYNLKEDLKRLILEIEDANKSINGDPDLNLTKNFNVCNTSTKSRKNDLDYFSI